MKQRSYLLLQKKIEELIKDLENFIGQSDTLPVLIKTALIHAPFETIHPYLDGNRRIGRLLITYYLHWTKSLFRIQSAREIITLKDNSIKNLMEHKVGGTNAIKLLDVLFDNPTDSTEKLQTR